MKEVVSKTAQTGGNYDEARKVGVERGFAKEERNGEVNVLKQKVSSRRFDEAAIRHSDVRSNQVPSSISGSA